jgi:predicted DNA-binding transcriptional regulator AlpA
MDTPTPNDRSPVLVISAAVEAERRAAKPGERLMRKAEIQALTGVCDETIRRWERTGRFPRRVRLDPTAGRQGAVAWLESEVLAWIAARANGREPVAG